MTFSAIHLTAPALAALVALAGAPASADPHEIRLIVGVHPQVSYTGQRAGQVIGTMRQKLTGACGPIAYPSPSLAALSASLPVNVDGGSDAVLGRFAGTDSSVQVVGSIIACPLPPTSGIIAGCARPFGPILVVPRSTAQRDAQIWAHEIGHAQRLRSGFAGYVRGHNPTDGNLMFAAANPNNWGMSVSECGKYYEAQTFAPSGGGTPIIVEDFMDEDATPTPIEETDPARAYLGAEWPHGLDFATLEENREAIVETAVEALTEPEPMLWPNAVLVVGYANVDGALGLVETVFQRAEAEDEASAFQINDAKINGGIALGYLGFHGVEEAVDRLENLRTTAGAAEVPFADDGREPGALAQRLALSATVGLAIAAASDDDAEEALAEQRFSEMQGTDTLGVDSAYFDQLDAVTERLRGRSLFEGLSAVE